MPQENNLVLKTSCYAMRGETAMKKLKKEIKKLNKADLPYSKGSKKKANTERQKQSR
jgi:hypothetical protein